MIGCSFTLWNPGQRLTIFLGWVAQDLVSGIIAFLGVAVEENLAQLRVNVAHQCSTVF
jgi:hypothetical protein